MNVVTFSSRSVVNGKPVNKEEIARLKRLLHEQDEQERKNMAQRESKQQAAE